MEPPAERPEERGEREEFVSSFGERQAFEKAVKRVKEYVHAGDVVQCVLSQRFERLATVEPFNIYRALRVVNPSPYMYCLDTGEGHIVGSSPEILVRLEGDMITLRPIAGTSRTGVSEEEDLALVMGVERYSHVMHMVSNVEGRLREGLDCFDVFRACFPAGTVTGAPKIRAMEIIEELEPVKRGPYAGAVGYFSYSGSMDTCITIRTLIIKGGRVFVQAGAGIVADSDPGREYQETVSKAMGMMRAVAMAEDIPG
jgi:anthranilate synthase component 1